MSKYKLCRGFKDLMPLDYKKYEFLRREIEEVSNSYGYKMVSTCCIEESSLFKSCYDKELDNELFEIENRFTNNVALNYDNTISLLRSVVENKLYVDKSLPLKLMYCEEKYFYNKKNPNRVSGYEYGFECIGDKSVYLDVESVLLLMRILNYLNIGGYDLRINNFGESEEYFDTFKQTLINLGIDFSIDTDLENRGYYTGIAYEIDIDDYDSVICGGRYDSLVNVIGGVSVGVVGSKIDFDLLIKILEDNDFFPHFHEEVDFYIVPTSNSVFKYALHISELLREMGALVEIHYKEYDLKRLADLLDRVDVTYSIVLDEDNEKNNTIKIRNSLNKEESVVYLKDFIKDLESLEEYHN